MHGPFDCVLGLLQLFAQPVTDISNLLLADFMLHRVILPGYRHAPAGQLLLRRLTHGKGYNRVITAMHTQRRCLRLYRAQLVNVFKGWCIG